MEKSMGEMMERMIARLHKKFEGTALVKPLTPAQETYLDEALEGKRPLSLALLEEAKAGSTTTVQPTQVIEKLSSLFWSFLPSRNVPLALAYGANGNDEESFELTLQTQPADVMPKADAKLLRFSVSQGHQYEVFHQGLKDAFLYLVELAPDGQKRLLKGFLSQKKAVETPSGGALFLLDKAFSSSGAYRWAAFYLEKSPWEIDPTLPTEATEDQMIHALERWGAETPQGVGFVIVKKFEFQVS